MSTVLNSIIKLKNEEIIDKIKTKETLTDLIGKLDSLKRKLN
jgi:hypothetical protein